MSRLTVRDEVGNADVIGANGASWLFYLECNERAAMTRALNRLADYEDALEIAGQTRAENRSAERAVRPSGGNKPLALEELLRMEGEPVWCEGSAQLGSACFWALCGHGKILTLANEKIGVKELKRKGAVFYKYKPE